MSTGYRAESGAGHATAADRPVWAAAGLSSMLREIGGGISTAFIVLPICMSSGVLAYAPLGPNYVARGAVAGILSAVAGGIVAALARSSSFITTVPATSLALIQASFLTSLLPAIGGNAALALIALPLSLFMTGLWLILFGLSGFSRIVKFTPYPVLAGFVTGIGLLVAVKQIPILFGVSDLSQLWQALAAFALPRPFVPLYGIGLVAAMFAVANLFPKLPVLLIGLVAGFGLFHGLHLVWPDLDLGATIGPVSMQWGAGAFDPAALGLLLADFKVLQVLLASSITLALLCTLDTLLVVRAVQNVVDIAINTRRDLIGHGTANLVAPLFGGIAVSSSLSFSMANYRGGGRTRVAMIVACLVILVVALFFPYLVAAMPLVVLASLLTFTAFRIVDRWIFRVAREGFAASNVESRGRARRNAIIVLTVLGATVFGQPVMGAGVGVILACLVFIADMSRPIVRRRSDAATVHSKHVRSRRDLEILRKGGRLVSVLELQGVMFFGNADDLATEIRALDRTAIIIILDFRRVSDVDVSGLTMLEQVAKRCRERNRQLILCGAHPRLADALRNAAAREGGYLFDDLDSALQWAEDALIDANFGEHSTGGIALEQTDLTQGLGKADLLTFSRYLKRVTYEPGTALCRVGEPADRLWVLVHGSVSVRVSGPVSDRRLASLGPGCSVGEMGLLEGQPRSADVVADDAVEAYMMIADQFHALLRDQPRIGQAILVNISRQLAQRLRVTSEDLRLSDS
jgi:SulP family sulfate permease